MKKQLLVLLILLPIFSFGQANKLFRKAINSKDSKEKIELFTKVIALEPKNFDAFFYRGIAKNDLGDYYGAILDYSKVIVYEPDADLYFNRGNSKYSLQDYNGAKSDYENALKHDPRFIDAQYNLAFTKYYLEDYMGALMDLNTVINIVPNESQMYIQRANTLLALEKHKLALEDFTLAILIDPTAENYFNRGLTHLNVNYYKQAKNDFNRSLNFDSSNISAYFYRGTSFLLLGKYDKAFSDFKTNLKHDALDFEAHLGIAITYYKMNDFANARLHFSKVVSILNLDETTSKKLESFTDTFWYQNQFYFFKENFEKISQL